MNRSLIKRIEFCKIKDFASNIKIMLRSTSHTASMQQNVQGVEQNSINSTANSINSTYEFVNVHREQQKHLQQQNHPLQKQRSMTNQISASTTNLGNKERGRRHLSLHNERNQTKIDQKDFMPSNQINDEQIVAGIYREGPCKRTLTSQNKDLKTMPSTILKIEDELMPKSELSSLKKTMRLGRKDKHQLNKFTLQNDNEKLSQSQLFADKNSINSIHRTNQVQRKSKIVQPRALLDDQNFSDKIYKLVSGRKEQIPFEQLKQDEIKEAKYGETLTKIAEKTASNTTCQLSQENIFKFSLKNSLQIPTPTLKLKSAERERKLIEKRKQNIQQKTLNPTIRFGRRVSESKAQQLNQLKETKILKSRNNRNDSTIDSNIYRHILRNESTDMDQPPQRFDEIFYRDSQKKPEKSYTQTWAEFPTVDAPEVDNKINYSPPPFVKRPKNERPSTAKPWGDVEQ